MKISIVIFFIFFSANLIFCESLWNDNYADIYSKNVSYKVGDSIKILINENQILNYKSSTKSLKTSSIDIKGGEFNAVLNFLPSGNTNESKNSNDSDSFKISATIVARIDEINNNSISISGTKQITLNNKQSSIVINGVVNFKDINSGIVKSDDIQNFTMRISTLLDNPTEIIGITDLNTVILNPDSTTDLREEIQLDDNKKRELYLEFINKLLNLIF